jgi:NAD(P)-dependent dehydrogenase (short-subunit alcohol dehydrogenase family)
MKIQTATALVTGANRGVGAAFVQALLQAGVQKVYATARDIYSLTAITELDPARVIPLQLDVTDLDAVAALPAQAPDVNLLINNAGSIAFGNILEVPTDTIAQQLATNFYGPLHMARAFAPVLEKNAVDNNTNSAIVNLLTLLSMVSAPGMSAYNVSKAAAWSMTQSLRASLADKKVDVYGVFPGAIDTDMLAGIDMAKTSPADVATAVLAGIETTQEDIFPDPMATQVYASWKQDHKAVEKQFASL